MCWTLNGSSTNSCTNVPSGATSYSYNNNGDRTTATPSTGSATNYSYNGADELTGVTTGTSTLASDTYDGTGLRASETAAGTTYNFAYDTLGTTPIILTDGQNSYIYGPSSTPIEQVSSAGIETYLHHDALGSVRSITNQAGTVLGTSTYTPYGPLAASTGTSTSRFGYAGAYTDPGTGFLYLENRYYDPATQQFLTVDPLEAETHDPYAYANDDPIDNTDPTGQSVCLFSVCVGFHPMAGLDALVNIGRGATAGLTDTIANSISPGASCTVPQDSLDQWLGNAATGLIGGIGVAKLLENGLAAEDEAGTYLAGKAPTQVPPGTTSLSGQYINDVGRVEPWTAHYDEYGRLIGRTDYNAGNQAQGIPDLHFHTYGYGPGYGNGVETGSHIPGEYQP